jgi:pyridoxal phosphate enzyme (YggS family)
MPDIAAARAAILARIGTAAKAAGRDPAAVTLVAACKTQGPEAIAAAMAAGQRVFGENRVQEAQARWAVRPEGLELRLIGPLQSNKARDAVELFDVIETLDRDSLARALADAISRTGRTPRLLVQVNTGREPQKAGLDPRDVDAALARWRRDYGLMPEGLMCIPPADEPAGPHFALLALIARDHGLSVLSMGMSGDFETAITFGATHVRVGTALFGERTTPQAASVASS